MVLGFLDVGSSLKLGWLSTRDFKMGLSRVCSASNKKGKNHIPSLPNGDKLSVQQSFFDSSSDFDILAWLRGVALDPCNPQASHSSVQKLHHQALKMRKILLMSNAECPRKKRKLELFLKGSNSTASSRPFEEKSNNKSSKRVYGTASVSYSLNSNDANTSSYPPIVSSLGSGSVTTVEDYFQGKQVNANLPGLENSDSLSSGIYMTPHKAVELLKTTGECPQKSVIPIGPRFQAELPEWNGKTARGDGDGDSEALKWLGTQCWPREGASMDGTGIKAIGKGRPKSCPCSSPGSMDCTDRHISEARRRLKSNLGPAFLTWKFDEMGDTVSSSWTSHEQETFESLVKANPMNTEVEFWKCAMKSFPSKCKKSLVKYYYNVFIPRRMRMETRSSIAREIVSDDDMPESDDDDEQAEEEQSKVQRLLRSCKR